MQVRQDMSNMIIVAYLVHYPGSIILDILGVFVFYNHSLQNLETSCICRYLIIQESQFCLIWTLHCNVLQLSQCPITKPLEYVVMCVEIMGRSLHLQWRKITQALHDKVICCHHKRSDIPHNAGEMKVALFLYLINKCIWSDRVFI